MIVLLVFKTAAPNPATSTMTVPPTPMVTARTIGFMPSRCQANRETWCVARLLILPERPDGGPQFATGEVGNHVIRRPNDLGIGTERSDG
jgi:hypothetical protein